MPLSFRPVHRGVFSPPWTDEHGRRLLVAVDRHGRQRYVARVFEGDEPTAVARMLRNLLDQVDPSTDSVTSSD